MSHCRTPIIGLVTATVLALGQHRGEAQGAPERLSFRNPVVVPSTALRSYSPHYTCFGYCPGGAGGHQPHYMCYGYCPNPPPPYYTCYGYCPNPLPPAPHYLCYSYCPVPGPYPVYTSPDPLAPIAA